MPTPIRLLLQFSGQEAFEQAAAAQRLLDEADRSDHSTRARLHAILAASRVLTAPDSALDAAAASARAAGEAGDAVSRAWALVAASVSDVSPASLARRRASTREALDIARAERLVEIVPTAFFLHLGALAEAGSIEDLDRALSPSGATLSAFPWLERERHVAWFRCLRALIDGQAALAEQLAGAALALAREQNDPDALSVWVGQLAIIRWMQGRVVELEPAFLQARQLAPHEPVWAASLAWMWLQQGRRSAARALVTTIAPVSELPLDRNWLATACILAEVAAELGEEDLVRALHRVLVPVEGRLVTMGLGVTTWGTVSRPLALLAGALGDPEGAILHSRRAIETAARAGAHPWLAEAQTELAGLLLRRAGAGDAEEAATLAGEAAATGRALHLAGIEEAADGILAMLGTARSAGRPPSRSESAGPAAPAGSGEPAFSAPSASSTAPVLAPGAAPRRARAGIRVLGTFEVVSDTGRAARWQSRKARQLLQILVARRGIAVSRESLMHLLWPDEPPHRLANRFSVAATTVRRALDPAGAHPSDTYVEARGAHIRLAVERIDIDVEEFLARAGAALNAAGPQQNRQALLREAFSLYRGEVLIQESEQLWAQDLQREAHLAFFAVGHALADESAGPVGAVTRLECYRRILAVDPYDQRAHTGVIEALAALGARGQEADARRDYVERMAELGIAITPEN